ncbi:Ribonuclease H-like domain containing protein [Trema orientale]|uniref:Ribonuclease H-like domain containing protein n=1 Tax=Trema orientale TaxID=63057 RepID=A0A2P5FQ33_TREOI|nr:Ribonuclease H-like domain containing protein [Trema orientale]
MDINLSYDERNNNNTEYVLARIVNDEGGEKLEPCKGMKFDSLEIANEFYLSEFQNSKYASEPLSVLVHNPPSSSWSRSFSDLKLKTDATVWPRVLGFGFGGVICESSRLVLACWSCYIPGSDDVEVCELLALREGIKLAINFGCILDEIESDSLAAVNAISKPKPCSVVASLVNDISFFISSAGCGSCRHISCKRNMVAHELAQFAIRSKCDRIWG